MTDGRDIGDDDEALAAEFALGLLGAAEAAAAERRIAAEPAFRAAVLAWQERLAGLAEGIAPVAPPRRVEAAMAARLFGAPRRAPRGTGWFGSVFGGALAALAVVALALVVIGPPARGPTLVAEVAATDGSLVIAARLDGGTLSVTRLSGGALPGRVLELWAIGGDGVPVSLGLLPEKEEGRLTLAGALGERLAEGVVLAVSDEPPGGSPTGQPTGAVLATGAITKG